MRIQRIHPTLQAPTTAHAGDAGFDLRSAIDIVISLNETKLLPTGFIWEIPYLFCGMVKGRSGLAINHNLHVFHGLIDSGFRGELCVAVTNWNEDPFRVSVGDRIAQLVILPVHNPDVIEVSSLTSTSRGTGGIGSTGLS